MIEITDSILSFILFPVRFFSDPGKRIYVPFLVVTLFMASGVYLWQSRRSGRSLAGLMQYLFSRKLWFHSSSLLDYKLFIFNGLFRALAPAAWSVAAVGAVVSSALVMSVEAPSTEEWSRTQIALSYTICLFVFGDFTRFVLHSLLHRVPLLWEFHKVHHSAEILTPITVYRTHPVEVLLYGIRGALSAGFVTGCFYFLFPNNLSGFDILGINLFGFLFNLLGSNLRHSHVWLSYGKFLEHVFISPAQHQVHHSTDEAHYNKNFGSCLAVWDYFGKSLYTTTGQIQKLEYGLEQKDFGKDGRLRSVLIEPFQRALGSRSKIGSDAPSS